MFSVLGRREVSGRTGTILEGESGANDPVGIALMIGMIEFATSANANDLDRSCASSRSRCRSGSRSASRAPTSLLFAMRRRVAARARGSIRCARSPRPASSTAWRPSLHGSGFLAVFVAGMLVGDARAPYKEEIEIVLHVAREPGRDRRVRRARADDRRRRTLRRPSGATAIVLALVARARRAPARRRGAAPAATSLRVGERLFVAWGGLKGAVPILLAAFAVLAGVDDARPDLRHRLRRRRASRSSSRARRIPLAASLAGVPMRIVRPPAARAARVSTSRSPRRSCGRACRELHPHQPRGWRHARLARLLVERLGGVDVHVDPDEVGERAGAHRPAGAVAHRRVEILDRHARLVEHPHAVVHQRDQDPVDDEPGRVVAAHRLACRACSANTYAVSAASSVVRSRADDLDERHQRRRVEEVHADDALRTLGRVRDLGHRERRRVRREDRVGPRDRGRARRRARASARGPRRSPRSRGRSRPGRRSRSSGSAVRAPHRAPRRSSCPFSTRGRGNRSIRLSRRARRARASSRGRPCRRRRSCRAARSRHPSCRGRRRRPSQRPIVKGRRDAASPVVWA